ncbi:MAG TPA: GIY-YIG nuclease family protein [Afipia sp.]
MSEPATLPGANNDAHECFVYVLGSSHKGRTTTYVGWTNDIARRLAQHNAGTGARSTRGRVWVLLHSESFATRNEAMSREWHLKRDRAFRKRLLMVRSEAFASRLEP